MRVGWGGIIFSPEGEGMYLHHLEKVSLRDKRQFIQALKALFFVVSSYIGRPSKPAHPLYHFGLKTVILHPRSQLT